MSRSDFNTGDPLAYFITWTTYGTWLPGDERGWQRKRVPGVQLANGLLSESAASKLKEPAFVLSRIQRDVVDETIRKHCDVRNWCHHIVNVRTNHVHVVVTANGYAPQVVRDQFKAWATRRLKKAGSARSIFWTEGGSCRWINSEDDLESAIVYVRDGQV